MSNMSLARIMYGTNDDIHVPYSMSLSTFSVRAVQPSRLDSAKSEVSRASGALNGILRKAWSALIGN